MDVRIEIAKLKPQLDAYIPITFIQKIDDDKCFQICNQRQGDLACMTESLYKAMAKTLRVPADEGALARVIGLLHDKIHAYLTVPTVNVSGKNKSLWTYNTSGPRVQVYDLDFYAASHGGWLACSARPPAAAPRPARCPPPPALTTALLNISDSNPQPLSHSHTPCGLNHASLIIHGGAVLLCADRIHYDCPQGGSSRWPPGVLV
jgi:hypothetical protein